MIQQLFLFSMLVLFYTHYLSLEFFHKCSSQAPSPAAYSAWRVRADLVLRKRRLDSMDPLGKLACHNLGLGRRTYASGNSEEMEIQSRETRESIQSLSTTFSHASTKPISHVGVDQNLSLRNLGKEQFLASVSCSLAWRKLGVNHTKI